jgi:hypothetical protein
MSAPTPTALEIHPGIVLKGQLSMENDVVLTGKFEGDLKTLGRLTVAPGGAATGSIDAGSLVLEPGNLVQARIKVSPPPPKSKAVEAPVVVLGRFWSAGFAKVKAAFSLGRK